LEYFPNIPKIEWVNADVTDPESILKACENVDIIFHCAAYVNLHSNSHHAQSHQINVEGTRNVVEAAKKCKVKRLILCSSITTIAVANEMMGNVTEESKYNLIEQGLYNSYAATKKEAENIVLEAVKKGEIDAVIANPTCLIGGFEPKPMIMQIIISCCRGQHTIVAGAMNIVDVSDVARGLICAWKNGKTGERYIIGGHNTTLYDLCRLTTKLYGRQGQRFCFLPKFIGYIVGYWNEMWENITKKPYTYNISNIKFAYASSTASTKKAETQIGYTITPLEDTVKSFLEYYKKTGSLHN